MMYIVALNAAVALVSYVFSYTQAAHVIIMKLILIPQLVLEGEVWRLITFLFIPETASPIWLLFTLYFYYMIGSSLEREWGSFKYNIYYLAGVLGTIGAAFILQMPMTATYLNLSLIFAFAYLFPNFQIVMFFILPVKIKYLAIAYAVLLVMSFRSAPIYGLLTIAGSMANFLLFFGKDIITRIATGRKAYYSRKSFEAKIPKDIVMHRCSVCGRTERDDKNLEFRYCVDCDGDFEYCMDHLYTHVHVKNGGAITEGDVTDTDL